MRCLADPDEGFKDCNNQSTCCDECSEPNCRIGCEKYEISDGCIGCELMEE